jgi:hypothetical protein
MSKRDSDWMTIQNTAYQSVFDRTHGFDLARDVTGDQRLGCRGLKMLK